MATLTPTHDAKVRGGTSSGTNFGSDPEIPVRDTGSFNAKQEAWLKFDISAITDPVTTARLDLWIVALGGDPPPATHHVQAGHDTAWDESTITWDTRPFTDAAFDVAYSVAATDEATVFSIDITDVLENARQAGASTLTLRLKGDGDEDDVLVRYKSQEGEGGDPGPEIVYETSTAQTTTPNGLQHGHTAEQAGASLTSGAVTVNPTHDAFLRAGSHADANFNIEGLRVRLGPNGDVDPETKEGLVKFSLADLITGGTAVLRLRRLQCNESFTVALQAFEDLAWDEGTVTWNSVFGATHDEERQADLTFTETAGAAQWTEVDVTSIVEAAAANGAATLTFWLYATNSTTSDLLYAAKEHATEPAPELTADFDLDPIPAFTVETNTPVAIGGQVQLSVSGLGASPDQYNRIEYYIPDPNDSTVGVLLGTSETYPDFTFSVLAEEQQFAQVKARAVRVDDTEQVSTDFEWLIVRDGQSHAPVNDAMMRGGANRSSNFNGVTNGVKLGPSGDSDDFTRETIVQFDLTAVTSAGSAVLHLYRSVDPETHNLSLQSLDNVAWDEATVTWDSLLGNTHDEERNADLVYTEDHGNTGWTELDVTDLVQAALAAGHTVLTFWIYANTGTTNPLQYASKEHTTDPAPELVIKEGVGPTLSNAAGSSTGETTADGSVSTDDSTGTVYAVVTNNPNTPQDDEIINGLDHQGVGAAFSTSQQPAATGTQNFNATGLDPNTEYWWHFVQVDGAGAHSNSVTSNSFTTDDVTAPSLSNATASATGSTTASASVDTTESGTAFVVATRFNTQPSVNQIKQGLNHNSEPVDYDATKSVQNAGTVAFAPTGLFPGVNYWFHFVQTDAALNNSNVVTSNVITTEEVSDQPGQPFAGDRVIGGDYALYTTPNEPPVPGDIAFYDLVGFNTEFTFSRVREMHDTTKKQSKQYAEFQPGLISATIQGTWFANARFGATLGQEHIINALESEEGQKLHWVITSNLVGSRQWYGVCFPSAFSDRFNDETISSVEITLQVTGAYTIEAVT